MRSMKKFLCVCMALVMICTCIGCSSKEDTKTTDESAKTEQTATADAAVKDETADKADTDAAADAATTDTADTTTDAATTDAADATTDAAGADAPADAQPEAQEPEIPETYIKDLFAQHGMKAGTCLTTRMTGNAKFSKIITEQFNSVTMENSMKPDYLFNQVQSQAKNELVVEFSADAKKMFKWAKENNMSMRGHTLVWHSQTPSWIFREGFSNANDYVSREVMLERMESYFKQVFALLDELGYTDMIYAYDIVNEAWMEDGTIRKEMNTWREIIGDDYLWYAFYFANKYAPESIDLYYNDYNEQFKTSTLVSFVDTLRDDEGNYLIDGIGLQAHLYTSDSLEKYFETIDALSATGLKLELTELDVCLGAYQNELKDTEENLAKQGRFYYDLINGIIERVDAGTAKIDAITFWGFADNMSWRSSASPLLYNTKYEPKPAYYGAMQMKEYAGY